jgi:hypothetical protein
MVHFSATLNIFEINNIIPTEFSKIKQSLLTFIVPRSQGMKKSTEEALLGLHHHLAGRSFRCAASSKSPTEARPWISSLYGISYLYLLPR